MRDVWFSRRVHPEGLEPSTNGLRDHCYDALNPDSIEPKRTPVWVRPLILCPLSQISVFLVLARTPLRSSRWSSWALIG